MENPAASQLPEVDSLPDGFLESSVEVDQTPTFDQENLCSVCEEDNVLKIEQAFELLGTSEQPIKDKTSMRERNSPDLLAEKDDLVSLRLPAEAHGESFGEQENTSSCVPQSGDFIPRSFVMVDSGLSAEFSGGHEQAESKCGTSEKSITMVSDSQPTHLKKNFARERTETTKKKKIDATDVVRKKAKSTFKSEKEFLKLTLNYQHVVAERDSVNAVRDKLESLCRELQRQNKLLTDEYRRVSTEGQNLSVELSSKFYDTIKDITIKLEEQKDECLSQFKENETLRSKLKGLCDQYTLSEQQFNQKLQEKSLELQLAELKIQEHEQRVAQQQSQLKLYAEQVSLLLATERNLRSHLAADEEKFQHFQESLDKSNEVFGTYKRQIEKTGKLVKELGKENAALKSNYEKTKVSLDKLIEEREVLKKRVEKTSRQKEKLESLCRSLQAQSKHNGNSETLQQFHE